MPRKGVVKKVKARATVKVKKKICDKADEIAKRARKHGCSEAQALNIGDAVTELIKIGNNEAKIKYISTMFNGKKVTEKQIGDAISFATENKKPPIGGVPWVHKHADLCRSHAEDIDIGGDTVHVDPYRTVSADKRFQDEISGIFDVSAERSRPSGSIDRRRVMKAVRTFRYPDLTIDGVRETSDEVHAFGPSSDIVAITSTNEKHSHAYTYRDLISKMESRLCLTDEDEEKRTGDRITKYFYKTSLPEPSERRGVLSRALVSYLDGDFEDGENILHDGGYSRRGRKWVHKLATIQLAERARELRGTRKGVLDAGLVMKAAKLVAKGGLEATYLDDDKAPFAGEGGAAAFTLLGKRKKRSGRDAPQPPRGRQPKT